MRLRPTVLVLIAAAVLLGACGGGGDATAALRGYPVDPAVDAGSLSLPDAGSGGAPFVFTAPDDGVLLVYFGYTSCPDVCPTTLSDIRIAFEDLAASADRLTLAMVTVDPERDTAEVLTSYVDHFVEGAYALRTDDDVELRSVADRFGVSYAVIAADGGGEPEVLHPGTVYAVDDTGRVVLQWPGGTRADDFAHDLGILLDA